MMCTLNTNPEKEQNPRRIYSMEGKTLAGKKVVGREPDYFLKKI